MNNKKKSKLNRLFRRYRYVIIIWAAVALTSIGASFYIYDILDLIAITDPLKPVSFLEELAGFLLTFGETILGAGLIGGGIGGTINFIFEELKNEEEERKEKIKEWQENREKRKIFRKEMQAKLQHAHDNVELARILIKSHKSGKTYGEQIRNRIMPSLISLLDFKRGLLYVEDKLLKSQLKYLQVSLNYMIAYLSALVEEFEKNYLKISNLQNYQDALAERTRVLFTELAANKVERSANVKKKEHLLENAEKVFDGIDIPTNFSVVWKAIEELDYIWEFIGELRNKEGEHSQYNRFFLDHYKHCKRILNTSDNSINQKLISKENYVAIMKEFERLNKKRDNDERLTKEDSLTRKIMEKELRFDFETAKKIKAS